MFISVHGVFGSGPRSLDDPPWTKLCSRARDRPAILTLHARGLLCVRSEEGLIKERIDDILNFFLHHSSSNIFQIRFVRHSSSYRHTCESNHKQKKMSLD